jgi:hypothetical protein
VAPYSPQTARLHSQTDQEQQQHDTEFCKMPDILDMGSDKRARKMWADNDARNQ